MFQRWCYKWKYTGIVIATDTNDEYKSALNIKR